MSRGARSIVRPNFRLKAQHILQGNVTDRIFQSLMFMIMRSFAIKTYINLHLLEISCYHVRIGTSMYQIRRTYSD
jgi:hypothetical protein